MLTVCYSYGYLWLFMADICAFNADSNLDFDLIFFNVILDCNHG
nr:Putative uncharacterized protein [Moritella viscosa]